MRLAPTLVVVLLLCAALYISAAPFRDYKADQKEIYFPLHNPQRLSNQKLVTAYDPQPEASFECEACDLVVKELVAYLNESGDVGETVFHQQADAICEEAFDEWLSGFCQYVIDGNILQLYEVIVEKKNPEIACQLIGKQYCRGLS